MQHGLNPMFVQTETPETDTRAWLERARAGDAEAYGEVCRAYATRLLRQAMAICGNAPLAEDLAQETLVEAWKCLHRYHGRCEFFTWLCAILLNRYRNTVRRNRLATLFGAGNRDPDEVREAVKNLPDHEALPDRAAALQDESGLIRQCIAKLPPKHQEVIYLRFYVDTSLEGIAAALGCSVGTVKSRLFHALDKLRGMSALSAEFVNLKNKNCP